MMSMAEKLQQIVIGATTLDKQEMMNIVCDALEIERVNVRIVPHDILMHYNQLIEEAK